jgi:DNA-binding Xre family transcriptional regulator
LPCAAPAEKGNINKEVKALKSKPQIGITDGIVNVFRDSKVKNISTKILQQNQEQLLRLITCSITFTK